MLQQLKVYVHLAHDQPCSHMFGASGEAPYPRFGDQSGMSSLLFAVGFAVFLHPVLYLEKRVHAADLQGGDFWACCAFVQVQA